MTRPEAVVFDIGNVLIRWDPEGFYDRHLGDRAAREKLFAAVDLHGMNDRIDRGAPFRETIYAEADRHPEHAELIRLWHDRWIDLASPRIDGSWAILRELRATGIPVFALSNFGIGSFAFAQTQYPELTEFDRRFISGHLGVIKPDPRIYEIVEEQSGLRGAALFFTDDRADNIAAAGARGWQTHRFEGPDTLADALASAGLDLAFPDGAGTRTAGGPGSH